MNLADVMDQVATQLDTITGLRVYAYPADSVAPPAAIVSYPETYTFDAAYGRGSDQLTLPVIVVVGKVSDRATKENLGSYVDGSGSQSIKAVVEAGTYTAFDSVRVADVEFDTVTIAGTDYMAGLFTLDIMGSGA